MLFTFLIRTLLIIIGLTGLAWGGWTLPIFCRQVPYENVARQIIAGKPFRLEALLTKEPDIKAIGAASLCNPSATRSAAVISLKIAEETIATRDQKRIEEGFNALRAALLVTLSCSPADSFSWLSLFWLDSTQYGFKPEYLKYLRLSYLTGGKEGWIAMKRNRLSFSIFEELPPDLSEKALHEFLDLPSVGLYEEAADILVGPAWKYREKIIPGLAGIPLQQREILAMVLRQRGVDMPDLLAAPPPHGSILKEQVR